MAEQERKATKRGTTKEGQEARSAAVPSRAPELFRSFVFLARGRVRLAHAEPPESIGQVGVSFRKGRPEFHRFLVVFHGLGQLALPRERQAPVVVGVGGLGPDLESPTVVFDRLV